MILRKPYAFLIKHFKLVHLILLVLSGFICYKTSTIVSFFRSYVANDYEAIITADFASNFISFWLYLAVVFLLVIIIAILYLFAAKKKPKTLYISFLGYYIILIVLIVISGNILTSLEKTVMAADAARAYRDISILSYIPQFAFIIVCAVRSLGFNVKQFNFESDLKDLTLSTTDDEEIELNFNVETYKSKRTIRRFFREFKYYVKENLFVVSCISVFVIGLLIYFIVTNASTYTTSYSSQEAFTYKGLNMKVMDSIITNVDLGGNVIKDGKYFLLIKMEITNNTKKGIRLDYDNLKLYYGNNYIKPSLDLGDNFLDYAVPYTDKTLSSGYSNTFVFAYEIDKNNIKDSFKIKMHTGIEKKKNIYYATSISLKIKPLILSELSFIDQTQLNEKLSFSGSYLLNSFINISDYIITDNYIYNYDYCTNSVCQSYKDIKNNTDSNSTMLIINANLSIDTESLFYKSIKYNKLFVENFINVEYTNSEGKSVASKVMDLTPSNYQKGFILKVPKDVAASEKINLLIILRNKAYRIILKS